MLLLSASGVLVALTMLLAILEGYLPLDIGRLPAIGETIVETVALFASRNFFD